ncbi:endonuclease [Ilyomonas limi]|uniref:Endonuclease n=1 Tax=Ilyomonas limi TaxID=2575867 RepID=A0A4U3KS41_9BACT|nr:endonuclease/exonuclease/phosphatase family protein [Ilyomonas limi]TKK65120.1 endonuclease [Ilyomonas limi]
MCKLFFFFLFFLTAVFITVNDAQAQTIRVLAYNIHHGEDVNGKLNLQQIADVINKANPDVVALEEVDSMTNRTNKVDQLKELAALTNMQYFYGKNMDYDGGGYGVGILTKWPITRTFTTRLPNFPQSEPRVAATVEVQLKDNKSFLFTAIHLDYVRNPAERIAQAKKLQEVFFAIDTPSILAGDFNAQPDETAMKDIIFSMYDETDFTGHSLSFPSDEPKIKIDYVLVSKNHHWEKQHYEVIDEKVASDHRPVLSVVQLK